MNYSNIMTYQEIHTFGIEIVHKSLLKDGLSVESVMTDLSINPQIVAKKNGKLLFILVRTACYPHMGKLESDSFINQFVQYASTVGADCFFASVGITNTDSSTDLEKSIPIKGAQFSIIFEGIRRLSDNSSTTISMPIYNKDGAISGNVERHPDGRHSIKTIGNADGNALFMSMFQVFAGDISDEQKHIFSHWAKLPENSWNEVHIEVFGQALMNYFMEMKTAGREVLPIFKDVINNFPNMPVHPLGQPLTTEIRNLFADLFGG